MNHVMITGGRGYIKNYGGWETLIHGIVDNWKYDDTQFYVTEVTDDTSEREFLRINNVECIRVVVKTQNALRMLIAETKVLLRLPSYMKHYHIDNLILYNLGARVSLFYWMYKPFFKKNRIYIMNNSDGMDWLRNGYSKIKAIYSSWNRRFFTDHVVDCLVCDCKEMERISRERMKRKIPPRFEVIYYGTSEAPELGERMPDNVSAFFDAHRIEVDNYYLIINRLVPENSYELILNEFINSDTKCDFIVVTNQDKEKEYFEYLKAKTGFEQDKRIKFVGTVYDKELLAWLRQKARAYINGHTLGGTNPGLLEALATTNVNLVRDCVFSREGAEDTALYFDEKNKLRTLIHDVDNMSQEQRQEFGEKAKKRMKEKFSWFEINEQYHRLFCEISSLKYLKG